MKNKIQKPLASLSLDLDNQWSYMKIHGDSGWETYPSYFSIFVPHVLKILDDLDLKITFFVVGQDAALDKNKEMLTSIVENGHEVGNHSFHHESWLHRYNKEQVEKEIASAEDVLYKLTSKKLTGFRGPGFSWSKSLLEVLKEKDYLYDASTLPTYIGPLARLYYFMTANLTKEEKEDRADLFGSFRDGLRPVKPYYWDINSNSQLLEIPVTTIPIFKTPFHLSYLLYLSRFSMKLMRIYLNLAIIFCRLTKTEPSFLLHPLDLIGGDQVKELAFFPGMDVDSQRKVTVFTDVIQRLSKHFHLVNMSEHALHLMKNKNLKTIQT